jgi:hypothetical protein
LWLEKKKIGESFKVQFGEKSPNNGKNRKICKTKKLEKKNHCCTHVHNSFFFWGEFSHWEIWRFSFFLVQIRDKSPQIEEKIAQKILKF